MLHCCARSSALPAHFHHHDCRGQRERLTAPEKEEEADGGKTPQQQSVKPRKTVSDRFVEADERPSAPPGARRG
ncbi:hypothetical protein FQA47_013114 [Oryzias melastigma]|uniref:Uncharacterized protein n=1 Tax=Oryzias melastigma TaxID=30732 RepID=A0A834BXG5_ORYME|nr:hypothetical protein FQA47_013114 [Oryzias melastigma]